MDIQTVLVYHNVTMEDGRPIGMLDGYADGHTLSLVAVLDDMPVSRSTVATLEDVYRLFNVGDDPEFGVPDARALAYRARRNRSLSVGDVVYVGGEWHGCASFGWTRINPPTRFADAPVRGTTPLAAGLCRLCDAPVVLARAIALDGFGARAYVHAIAEDIHGARGYRGAILSDASTTDSVPTGSTDSATDSGNAV